MNSWLQIGSAFDVASSLGDGAMASLGGSVVFTALAEAAAPPAWAQFVPILLIFGVFYFVVMAPMRKRQKALDDMVASLKKGDKVITNGGIHGEIVKVEDDVIHLKVADNVRLKMSRSAVSGLASPGSSGS